MESARMARTEVRGARVRRRGGARPDKRSIPKVMATWANSLLIENDPVGLILATPFVKTYPGIVRHKEQTGVKERCDPAHAIKTILLVPPSYYC